MMRHTTPFRFLTLHLLALAAAAVFAVSFPNLSVAAPKKHVGSYYYYPNAKSKSSYEKITITSRGGKYAGTYSQGGDSGGGASGFGSPLENLEITSGGEFSATSSGMTRVEGLIDLQGKFTKQGLLVGKKLFRKNAAP